MLEAQPGLLVVGQAADGADAVEADGASGTRTSS